MRLIDADNFRNRMYHEAFEKDSDMQKWDSGCWIRYKLFENVLREQPTAQPLTACAISDEDGNIKCSNCGSSECWGNYCMNCGAKMEGDTDATD